MLARCLLGFVIWYKFLVGTFGVLTIVTVPNGGSCYVATLYVYDNI